MRPLHSVNKQIEIANITKKKSPENFLFFARGNIKHM
jgi:hypothetical protein